MATLWRQGTKLVKCSGGQLAYQDDCPCCRCTDFNTSYVLTVDYTRSCTGNGGNFSVPAGDYVLTNNTDYECGTAGSNCEWIYQELITSPYSWVISLNFNESTNKWDIIIYSHRCLEGSGKTCDGTYNEYSYGTLDDPNCQGPVGTFSNGLVIA